LCSIELKLRLHSLAEGDGFGGDSVHMRTALEARKNLTVNERRDIFNRLFGLFERIADFTLSEDQPATRAAQCLVCSRCNDMKAIIKRIRQRTTGNQTGYMRHVGHQ